MKKALSIFVSGFFAILILMNSSFAQPAEVFGPHPGIHEIESLEHQNDPISTKKLPETGLAPALSKSTIPQVSHEVFGYLPYWKFDSYVNFRYDLLTTLAYFSAEIETNGNISTSHHWPNAALVRKAHNNGVRIVLVATLFGSSDLQSLLSSAANRTNCVNKLVARVKAGDGDGINIDFESLPSSQRGNLVKFMQELADTFRAQIPNAHISMATPAVDWSNAWDYRQLSEICDALFIMGYNYHWSGSGTAGPVAPLIGGSYNITSTVTDYLAKTFGNSTKIILGLPYYGIDWPTVSEQAGAATKSTGSSRLFASAENRARQVGKRWHNDSRTPWYRYQSIDWRQCWYDDSTSLTLKYQFAKSKNLQGVGMWALGYDDGYTELWGAIEDVFVPQSAVTPEVPLPGDFTLLPNYPNPANPGTIFPIRIDDVNHAGLIQIQIYNLLGEMIYHGDKSFAPGEYHFYWNGLTDWGSTTPSGIYLFTVQFGEQRRTQLFTLLK